MQELSTGFLLSAHDIADEARRNAKLPGKLGLIEAGLGNRLSDPRSESV